jgi:hypothetical protein
MPESNIWTCNGKNTMVQQTDMWTKTWAVGKGTYMEIGGRGTGARYSDEIFQ